VAVERTCPVAFALEYAVTIKGSFEPTFAAIGIEHVTGVEVEHPGEPAVTFSVTLLPLVFTPFPAIVTEAIR